MKKRVIITSLVIMLLGSAAAVAQSVRSSDAPSGPEVKLTLTPSSDCYAGSTPQSYCQYKSAAGAAVVDSVAYYDAQVNSVNPAPGTLGSGWVTDGVVIVDFNSNSTPPSQWPTQIEADITLSGGGSTPTPTPAAGQYTITATLPSSSGLNATDSDDNNYSATFVVTTDSKAQISLTANNFQPEKAEYICQHWSQGAGDASTLFLSSTACTSQPQPGLVPTLINASVLQYPAHPAANQLVSVNAYSASNIAIQSKATAFELTKATSTATTTASFTSTTSGLTALIRLQSIDSNVGDNGPTFALTMPSNSTMPISLPYSTTLSGYKILGVDSTGAPAITASPSIIQPGVTTLTLANAVMPNLRVKNWPSYMAMGTESMTPYSESLLDGSSGQPARITDAIFKYADVNGAGDAGQINDPNVATNVMIGKAKDIQAKTHHDVIPVLVEYTINLSGTNEPAALADLDLATETSSNRTTSMSSDQVTPCVFKNGDSQYTDVLCMHYYNVIAITQQLQNSPIASAISGKGNFYGTLILNPDFIGELHKDYSGLAQTHAIPVAPALQAAVTAYASAHGITAPAIPTDLSSNGTMPQYIESLNWIVKTFGPNVTFGWQDNVWAGDTNGAVWLHQAVSNPALISQHVESEANFWKSMGVYTGAYKPDFLAFDKYELDYETNGNIINSAYYYEAPMWDVYLSYVGGMSQALNNIPIMLWQIPGAHLRTTTDAANEPNENASTAPDYFLGDPTLDVSLSATNNLAHDLASIDGAKDPTDPKNWTGVLTTLNSASFPDETLLEATSTCAPSLLFISAQVDCQNDVLSWHNSHLYNALHSNVFAILWGGGSTTGIASDADNLDDNGWLAGRLKDYYANPIQLPDGN